MQDGIGISSKPDAVGDLVVTITVKTMMDPGTLARVAMLQKQKTPKYIELGSDQSTMDLFSIGVTNDEAMEALIKAVDTLKPELEPEPEPSPFGDTREEVESKPEAKIVKTRIVNKETGEIIEQPIAIAK